MKKKIEKDEMEDFAPQMYSVLKELQESAAYWSEYFVPLGIVDTANDISFATCYKTRNFSLY